MAHSLNILVEYVWHIVSKKNFVAVSTEDLIQPTEVLKKGL